VSLGGPETTGNLVERMRVEGSMESGIVVQGHGARVRNNVLIGVGHSTNSVKFGIHASSGAGIRISDNQLVDTAVRGPIQVEPIDLAAASAQTDAIGAVIERNFISNAALNVIVSDSATPSPVGIHIYPAAGSTTVVRNRIVNMATGIDNSGASSLYLSNTVSGAVTPYSGGVMAGSTNYSF
jgi:hypothetical protein